MSVTLTLKSLKMLSLCAYMAFMHTPTKKALIGVTTLFLLAFLSPSPTKAQISIPDDPTIPEVHITKDGKVTIQGLKVMQRINTTFFTRTEWDDDSFLRWTLKTGASTDIRKRFGGTMVVSEIKEGDYLYVEGIIENGSTLSINAKKVIDWSDYAAQGTLSGTVREIKIPSTQFSLLQANYETVDVFLNATTTVLRNRRPVLPSLLKAGDTVSSIDGVYDSSAKKMLAKKIVLYVDPTIFVPQNYQGTLKSVPSGSPTTFTLTINGKDYTVVLTEGANILNYARQSVTFTRWLLGDTVRVYGFIREDSDLLDTIQASVIRNINF